MKQALAIFLIFCLLFSVPALAAPTRPLSWTVVEQPDLAKQIQPLVDAVAATAIQLEQSMYRNGTAPTPALVQGLLSQALRNHLLVAQAVDGKIALSMEEATAFAESLFSFADLPPITEAAYPGVSVLDGVLTFDLNQQEDYIGAYIYDIGLGEDELLVFADIFTLSGLVALAEEAPEEALTWLGHIGLRLKPEANSLIGFTLASFAVPERYTPAKFIPFELKDRFELLYPDFLSVQVQDEAALLHLSKADGTVSLRVTEQAGTLDSVLTEMRKEATPLETVGWIENNRLLYFGPGFFGIAYEDSNAGPEVCLVLEVRFPAEKQHEYELYRNFIDNSFVVYSHSVG